MTDFTPSELDGFVLNVSADMPDSQDYFYTPPPVQLKPAIEPPNNLIVLDQESEGACTGFGLAAAINLLNQGRKHNVTVSSRMLYEMARKFDEWPGKHNQHGFC